MLSFFLGTVEMAATELRSVAFVNPGSYHFYPEFPDALLLQDILEKRQLVKTS